MLICRCLDQSYRTQICPLSSPQTVGGEYSIILLSQCQRLQIAAGFWYADYCVPCEAKIHATKIVALAPSQRGLPNLGTVRLIYVRPAKFHGTGIRYRYIHPGQVFCMQPVQDYGVDRMLASFSLNHLPNFAQFEFFVCTSNCQKSSHEKISTGMWTLTTNQIASRQIKQPVYHHKIRSLVNHIKCYTQSFNEDTQTPFWYAVFWIAESLQSDSKVNKQVVATQPQERVGL